MDYIYCAVDKNNNIRWVPHGVDPAELFYFTEEGLSEDIEWHNKYHSNDLWRVGKFKLVEIKQ